MRRGRRSWATRSEIVDAGHVLIGLMLVAYSVYVGDAVDSVNVGDVVGVVHVEED